MKKYEPRLTCAKYSCDILWAQAIHNSRGLVGLDTSAHLISIRRIKARFSGVVRLVESGVLLPVLCCSLIGIVDII